MWNALRMVWEQQCRDATSLRRRWHECDLHQGTANSLDAWLTSSIKVLEHIPRYYELPKLVVHQAHFSVDRQNDVHIATVWCCHTGVVQTQWMKKRNIIWSRIFFLTTALWMTCSRALLSNKRLTKSTQLNIDSSYWLSAIILSWKCYFAGEHALQPGRDLSSHVKTLCGKVCACGDTCVVTLITDKSDIFIARFWACVDVFG